MIRKNKKGFLLAEQTVKIIIALLSIIILVFLLVSLYYGKVTAEKKRQANQILIGSSNSFEDFLNTVESGKVESNNFPVKGAVGWYFYFFTGQEIKPNTCVGKNCVCICDDVVGFNLIDWSSERERQIEECNENGACLIVENLKEYGDKFEMFEITTNTNILIEKQGEKIALSKT